MYSKYRYQDKQENKTQKWKAFILHFWKREVLYTFHVIQLLVYVEILSGLLRVLNTKLHY